MPLTDIGRVKHLVVLMLENRSFDHALGALALTRPDVDGVTMDRFNVDFAGRAHPTVPLGDARARRFETDPPHDSKSVALQMSNGMGGFVRAFETEHGSGHLHGDVMRYLDRAEQPMTYFLAEEYTICQRWFSPIPTQTIPNRLYSIGGSSAGLENNPSWQQYLAGIELRTVFDLMSPADWRVYAGALPLGLLVKQLRGPLMAGVNGHGPRLRRLHHFVDDARAGALPRLTWIEPTYSWSDVVLESNDDHPPVDVMRGQELIRTVYDALSSNPAAWAETVLVITYDEHGGFYDHVQPPEILPGERGKDGFTQRGPRVPAIVVSPFAARGACEGVEGDVWDHCSILKFVCDWLGLPAAALGPRVSSPHLRSLADLLVEHPRTAVPASPSSPAFRPEGAFESLAPMPRLRELTEAPQLMPGDLPQVIDDLRLQIEREYPQEFRQLFDDLAGAPPIRAPRPAPAPQPMIVAAPPASIPGALEALPFAVPAMAAPVVPVPLAQTDALMLRIDELEHEVRLLRVRVTELESARPQARPTRATKVNAKAKAKAKAKATANRAKPTATAKKAKRTKRT